MPRRIRPNRTAASSHVDPALDGPPPAPVSATDAGLERELAKLLASKAAAPNDTAAAAVAVAAGATEDEAEATTAAGFAAEARRVREEGGDAAVQRRLQQEIGKVKALERDIAIVKKKVTAALRGKDEQAAAVAKVQVATEALHVHCKEVLAENERRGALLEAQVAKEAEVRATVKAQFMKDIAGVEAKLEEQAVKRHETDAENATLEATFADLKGRFDEFMAKCTTQFTGEEGPTRQVLTELNVEMVRSEQLQQAVQAAEREAKLQAASIEAYKEQIQAYGGQLGEFSSAVARSQEVKDLTARQLTQLQERLAAAGDARKADADRKRAVDKETAGLQEKVRDLKRRAVALEKTKAQAEQRARKAQEAARKAASKSKP